MDKFWEWMKEKEYGKITHKIEMISYRHNENQVTQTKVTKQMLIGYMIEYLIENDRHFDTVDAGNIKHVYNQLTDRLKELDNGK